MPNKIPIDKSWSLFLDRDGVINVRKLDAYVLKPADFTFCEEAEKSIARLSQLFGPVVVVTNQQGIGKGLMNEDDLHAIHTGMVSAIEAAGGRIDKIYYCPELKEARSFLRKPSPGMALKAKKDFPEMQFKKSVMVGDTISDMKFGKQLKMVTVFIGEEKDLVSKNHKLIDYAFPGLKEFADFISLP